MSTSKEMQGLESQELRRQIRNGEFSGTTSGKCPGFAQANLCILPKEYAFDFLLFCLRNPKPCPLLEVLEPGKYKLGNNSSSNCDNDSDCNVLTDVPLYHRFENGELVDDTYRPPFEVGGQNTWFEDMVTFVIGCSFSFEEALIRAGIDVRNVTLGCNVPMYKTNIKCCPAGIFSGNMVVSMRPMSPADAIRATQITARYGRVHGAPVHIGDPNSIGIQDITSPDFGDSVPINPDEICVFWACGVTPQLVVQQSKPSLCITHAPGKMLVLDMKNEELAL
jgi:uncharacterized protein YcsI (UPF0317 family)